MVWVNPTLDFTLANVFSLAIESSDGSPQIKFIK